MTTAARAGIPVVPWGDVRAGMDWRQGEHVTLVGPTGCGKTTLALGMLPSRRYVVAIGTKPKDRTLAALSRQGYRRVARPDEWPPPMAGREPAWPRVLFWPRFTRPEDVPAQRAGIEHVLRSTFASGGWCVFADELRYITQFLGLQSITELMWLQGRSIGLSLVSCSQRPAWVPLEAFSQATHVVMWRATDRRDVQRLSDIGGIDVERVRHVMALEPDRGGLGKHDFLYMNARTGHVARSRYQP